MANDVVHVHEPGPDCWCGPVVVPIGIEHHARLNEWHEIRNDDVAPTALVED